MAEVGRAAMHGAARGRGMAAHRNRWCRSKLMEGHWNNIKRPLKLIKKYRCILENSAIRNPIRQSESVTGTVDYGSYSSCRDSRDIL